MKLLAIDGNSIINRAFYGIKLLSAKDGQYTNAVYGFINILNRLVDDEKPDGVAVAFDLRSPTFRHKEYSEYKAGRKPMPPELAAQFSPLKKWLTLMGYTVIECEGYEADDILGTLANAAEKSDGDLCVIATGDRDSLQLVSERTRVLLAATKAGKPEITNYTPAVLFERYGLTPSEMIELKSLMGDSSDNIPGVAGIGEKTATDLVSRYHSIDYIYEHLEELEIKEGVRNKLQNGKDSAYLSRYLGTICRTAPISAVLSDYKIGDRNTDALSALMTKLELFKLMERMGISPSSPQQSTQDTATEHFEVAVAEDIPYGKTVDILITDEGAAVVFENKVFTCENDFLFSLLTNAEIKKRVYDYKNLSKKYPAVEGVVFDAMLAAYLSNPSASDYGLDRLISEYGDTVFSIDGEYTPLIENTVAFSLLCDRLYDMLSESGEVKLLEEIELPLARALAEMETAGFLVDCDGLRAYGNDLAEKVNLLTEEIYDMAGCTFNLNSPKQLGEVLFEKMGIPAKKKTKNGYSTNADVLEELRCDFPIVDRILKYRRLAKLKSTYCDGLIAAVSDDGRIHTTFKQTEARTGRISSLEPNLQNIPARTDEGRVLRKFFTAPEGHVLCDADYSQIELRVLASIADDKAMIEAFESGMDIHTATASQVFNIPPDMVLPVMRSRAKAVNFGIVYGIGAFSLSKDIGVTRSEADRYIKDYLAAYPSVAEYMDKVIERAKEDGFVTTAFGRRRYLPELKNSNRMLRAFGERVARNAPIQGTAADIIKIAMIRVRDRLKKELPDARLILQVHDELIVECPEKDADIACRILEDEMSAAADLRVKLTADSSYGKNWLEAKG